MSFSNQFHTKFAFQPGTGLIKKLVVGLIVGAAATSVLAQRCEAGIYMLNGLSPNFYSVHINGDSAIVVSLSSTVSAGIPISAPGVGTARPSALSTWSFGSGSFDGGQYNLVGETFYGSCTWTGSVSCDGGGGASVNMTGLSQTLAGRTWGVNCSAIPLTPQSLRRIF
jgi:hypothetical protein